MHVTRQYIVQVNRRTMKWIFIGAQNAGNRKYVKCSWHEIRLSLRDHVEDKQRSNRCHHVDRHVYFSVHTPSFIGRQIFKKNFENLSRKFNSCSPVHYLLGANNFPTPIYETFQQQFNAIVLYIILNFLSTK